MKYFNLYMNDAQVRSEYVRLTKTLHPDMGGTNEAFQEMSNEYNSIIAILKYKDEIIQTWSLVQQIQVPVYVPFQSSASKANDLADKSMEFLKKLDSVFTKGQKVYREVKRDYKAAKKKAPAKLSK